MPKIEKKLNKLLIGAILGTTILGVAGASMTPKGKSLMSKVKDFIKGGFSELKKTTDQKLKNKKSDTDKETEE